MACHVVARHLLFLLVRNLAHYSQGTLHLTFLMRKLLIC